MRRLIKLGADGQELPDDATGHTAVRFAHPLLASPIIWTAQRSEKRLTWKKATAWAKSLTINGWSWRLPTAEEAFLLPDRSRIEYPLVDPAFFPDCDGEVIWTSTEQAADSGYAWYVYLHDGGSGWSHRNGEARARAVRAGQY